jgi:hypothetical protein
MASLDFPRNSMVALGIPGTLGICGEFPRNTLANWVALRKLSSHGFTRLSKDVKEKKKETTDPVNKGHPTSTRFVLVYLSWSKTKF